MYKIQYIIGREILDSRGNPTVEAEVVLDNGSRGRASVPSGASTGAYEALELRDGDMARYHGKGVQRAVSNINTVLHQELKGMRADDQYTLDMTLRKLDGTEDKSYIGANALLAVSLAAAKASAAAYRLPLYRYLGGQSAHVLPVPMMNILNGGAHASNNVDIQEFMIMPVGACCLKDGIRMCSEVFHELKQLLSEKRLSTASGDEGGFAPNLDDDEEAIEYILEAIYRGGYTPGNDFVLALDAAASEWKCGVTGKYRMPKSGKEFDSESLISHWEHLCTRYPIASIEDGLEEEDWNGWKKLTEKLGNSVQLVGDDLFVTNTKRLKKGTKEGCANSILIKLNQIGTLSETMDAVITAKRAGYTAVISHRSGETEDTAIADLSVALNCGQIKTGAPCRSERTAKYNQLLRIEAVLKAGAVYPGKDIFHL